MEQDHCRKTKRGTNNYKPGGRRRRIGRSRINNRRRRGGRIRGDRKKEIFIFHSSTSFNIATFFVLNPPLPIGPINAFTVCILSLYHIITKTYCHRFRFSSPWFVSIPPNLPPTPPPDLPPLCSLYVPYATSRGGGGAANYHCVLLTLLRFLVASSS